VHGVEGVARLRFDRRPLYEGWDGQFDPYSRVVSIAPIAPLPLCAGVHEIGHVMDALFLMHAGGRGRSPPADHVLCE
jgi:hypothetical protein